MRVDSWPRAGRVVHAMLVSDVDESDPDFGLRPRWQWQLLTLWSEVELVGRSGPGAGAAPYVELWRLRWKPLRYDEEVAYVTDTTLAFPSLRTGPGREPITFYRTRSFRELGEARRDFDLMARSVQQALRPLS